VIDVVEPFFKVIAELGYDRSIPPWEPTPARLIPTLNPGTVAADLVNAVGETSQQTVRRGLAATQDQITETIGAVKSVIGNGRSVTSKRWSPRFPMPSGRRWPAATTKTTTGKGIKAKRL
jgi:hypothetical protein